MSFSSCVPVSSLMPKTAWRTFLDASEVEPGNGSIIKFVRDGCPMNFFVTPIGKSSFKNFPSKIKFECTLKNRICESLLVLNCQSFYDIQIIKTSMAP